MSRLPTRAILWGAAVSAYLYFGLEATGWLFYEASFALHTEWLYWGYTAFRGGDYLFSLWPYHLPVCTAVGLLVTLLLVWRSARKEKV